MKRTVGRALLGFVLGLTACGDGGLDPLPLDIALEASRTTAEPGEIIDFVATARGGSLLGVSIDYGDESGDQFATGGARTAHITFSHAFSVAGVYQVRATVTDATAGTESAGVQITIP